MKHASWLSLPLATFGCLIPLSTQAQVTPDGTTSTTVNQNGDDFTIEQGDRVGDNLFHSFSEFSVPTQGSAVFNNADSITNIFSRVTGSDISSIDGLLGANSTANLYLINPNGIIFGENASLNLGGSFFASTADSLLFEGNAEFSAVNPQAPPLLEVSIPIGARFRDNPGNIVNRSFALNDAGDDFVGLEVQPGKNLTLLGGNINFEEGEATANGGNIKLGGLSTAGTIGISGDGSLSFPENVARADILLSGLADIDVTSGDSGSIVINVRNLNLEAGESGISSIRAGIIVNSTSADAQAGNIRINATDNVIINDSEITNIVNSGAIGNGGNITITADSLVLANGGIVAANTRGEGNAGIVEISAANTITVDGENFSGVNSSILNQVNSGAIGDAGNIEVDTVFLSLTNGGRVAANTLGQGDAGSVDILATDTINIDGQQSDSTPSGIRSQVIPGAIGNGGSLTINTGSLLLTNGGQVDASTSGQGNAGSIDISAIDTINIDSGEVSSIVSLEGQGNAGGVNIDTGSLFVTSGGRVDASTEGKGNAGSIDISAIDTINIDGASFGGIPSGISSLVGTEAEGNSEGVIINTGTLSLDGGIIVAATQGEGNAGGVIVNTDSLSLTNGGLIDASTFSEGDANFVEIFASDTITIDGENANGLRSAIQSFSGSEEEMVNAGGIAINTGSLFLTNGGQVETSTIGKANGGSIEVSATDTIVIDGEASSGASSSIESFLLEEGEGNAGNISINTDSLTLTNGGGVSANTLGQGNAGSVEITASDTITIDGEDSSGFPSTVTSTVSPGAEGDAGSINITTSNLNLTNGGAVSVSTGGQGNAGSIEITVSDTTTIDGEDSSGSPSGVASQVISGAIGNAGNVSIITSNLNLLNGGQVDASTGGQGNAGLLEVFATDTITIDGVQSTGFSSAIISSVGREALGDAGNINITTGNLNLTNGGRVSATTLGEGNAGDITIGAEDSIYINGLGGNFLSGLSASALVNNGNGGDINLFTDLLTIEDGGIIEASNFDSLGITSPGIGQPGNINIQVNSIDLKNIASIETATQFNGEESANINLQVAKDITLENNSFISAQAFSNANGGNLIINANDGFILAFSNQNSDIIASAEQGNGGNIEIFTQAIFGLEERSSTPFNQTNDIDASSEFGLQGDFSLNTPDFDPTTGLINLPASVGDATDQISQNPCQQGVGSEFIVTGKGGLPPSVNESVSSESARVGLIEPIEARRSNGEAKRYYPAKTGLGERETGRQGENIDRANIPAQGWVFNDKGEVTLTAYKTADTKTERSIGEISNSCSVSSFQNR